jgi:hypothetical protein
LLTEATLALVYSSSQHNPIANPFFIGVHMFLEMFRFAPQRRQPFKIFAFGGGKSLRLDLSQPKEVEDELGYKILAEYSHFIRKVEPKAKPKVKRKPKAPVVTDKQMPEDSFTTS